MIKKLKNLVVLVAAFMMLNSCTQPVKKDIGLQLYSLRSDMRKDVPGTIAKVGEMGFTFVEKVSDAVIHHPSITPAPGDVPLEHKSHQA